MLEDHTNKGSYCWIHQGHCKERRKGRSVSQVFWSFLDVHALTLKSSSSALRWPLSPQIYNFLQMGLFGLVFVCVSATLLQSELPAHSVVLHLSQITPHNRRGTICQLYAWVSNRIHHLLLWLDSGRQVERTYVGVYVCVCVCVPPLREPVADQTKCLFAKRGHFGGSSFVHFLWFDVWVVWFQGFGWISLGANLCSAKWRKHRYQSHPWETTSHRAPCWLLFSALAILRNYVFWGLRAEPAV